jgi:hypothetical protein
MNEIEIDAPQKVPTIKLKQTGTMNEVEIDAPIGTDDSINAKRETMNQFCLNFTFIMMT